MKEDFPIFVKWFDTTDWILDTVEKFPKSVRFTISGRMANMTLDVMEGIIEAIYTKDRSYILDRLNLYIEKLRVMFRITYKRKYISAKQYEHVSGLLNETGKMIGGWKKNS
ncbi:MAG: diversity-generating retroelement protein Avd [Desulfobacteraceae bacterium]|nr:diversity-generating retroelement protein Avd [Pseudomonadota bacterium]MBU4257998.1 diversity-generating retroelement protein Avd [Pseudomonadota bacterium]MCG2759232.1 diversity-generating retroelement protein Avd [Desulfobacteraceae bacterium]